MAPPEFLAAMKYIDVDNGKKLRLVVKNPRVKRHGPGH